MSESILQEAERLINGDRHSDYGPYSVEAVKIADMWSVILGCNVSPRQVPMCMIAMKLVRELNKPKRDNRTDIAGYCGLLDQLQVEKEANDAKTQKIVDEIHERWELEAAENAEDGIEMFPLMPVGQSVSTTTMENPGQTEPKDRGQVYWDAFHGVYRDVFGKSLGTASGKQPYCEHCHEPSHGARPCPKRLEDSTQRVAGKTPVSHRGVCSEPRAKKIDDADFEAAAGTETKVSQR